MPSDTAKCPLGNGNYPRLRTRKCHHCFFLIQNLDRREKPNISAISRLVCMFPINCLSSNLLGYNCSGILLLNSLIHKSHNVLRVKIACCRFKVVNNFPKVQYLVNTELRPAHTQYRFSLYTIFLN